MRLLKLNKESDDSCFRCALSLSGLCVLYVYFTVRRGGVLGEQRICGLAEKGGREEGEVGEGSGHRSRPFLMEQTIGWSGGTCNGKRVERLIGGWDGQVRDL